MLNSTVHIHTLTPAKHDKFYDRGCTCLQGRDERAGIVDVVRPAVFSLRPFLALPDSARASRAPLPVNFSSTSAITSFASRCTGPRDFARFVVGSLCRQDLLCFFKVDLLFHIIAR
jgi:hypothetical protein